jgi:hypothetical protein
MHQCLLEILCIGFRNSLIILSNANIQARLVSRDVYNYCIANFYCAVTNQVLAHGSSIYISNKHLLKVCDIHLHFNNQYFSLGNNLTMAYTTILVQNIK